MAKLPKDIRKPGGDLVAARSPFTRRVLLPTEADLCNALGLTEEEYFQFLEGVAAKAKERPEAYDLIPDIRCDPVSLGLAIKSASGMYSLTLLGQVVVGVALSVISYLLTPKPKSMKQGTAERTADIAGLKRFAPQFSFNSVQELANLGDLIPLVFTNRDHNPEGGVRVNSQLMWSQLVSLGRYQQLKILGLFSLGRIKEVPEFKGYAIGDLLIENYQRKKIHLSGNNLPFKTDGGVFSDSTFRVDGQRHFSGARNPTTQATFGLSSPMPNCTYFRLPYELVRAPGELNSSNRPAARITNRKRIKLLGAWPTRAGFLDGGTDLQKAGDSPLNVGTNITYQIVGGIETNSNAWQQDEDRFGNHGVEDVNSISKTIREATDSQIVEGETYMAGTALVTCTHVTNEQWPGQPWDGTASFTREYNFEVTESGLFESLPQPNLTTHCQNPKWLDGKEGRPEGDYFEVKDSKFHYEQQYNQLYEPCKRYVLQRASIGTVSDNRDCEITEIGFKSKVFKQMSFANVNSKPTEEDIQEILDDKSSISLGNVQKYIVRYSFFKLQIREAGQDGTWKTLEPNSPSDHLGLFCIRGNTPEFQYNYVRIDHPKRQYEYRFLPWPGNDVIKQIETTGSSKTVCLLNANGAIDSSAINQFNCSPYVVKFAGKYDFVLTKEKLSNPEWEFGELLVNRKQVSAFVQGISGASSYAFPSHLTADNLPQKKVSTIKWTKIYHPTCTYPGSYVPNTNHTLIVQWKNWPVDGISTFNLYINPSDVTTNEEGRTGPDWGNAQQVTNVSLISAQGGGETVSGVIFSYETSDGRTGRFIPVKTTSIPGNIGGYPCGKVNVPAFGEVTKTYWYVRKIEDEWQDADQIINTLVTTSSRETQSPRRSIANGTGLQVRMQVWANDARTEIFARWYLDGSRGSNYRNGDAVIIPAQKDSNNVTVVPEHKVDLVLSNTDEKIIKAGVTDDGKNLNLYDAASDYWKYEGDQSSHLDGPEHQITYCNEIVKTYSNPATYENLAYVGLKINSSKEWTNFSQLSAYFQKGVVIKKPQFSPMGPYPPDTSTSLFPEIAFALLTDETLGAGKVINKTSVHEYNMAYSAEFCKRNGFFWDGVLSNRVNLREFIFENANYCLLDFTIIGGQFSLYPAVPVKMDYTIDFNAKPTIKAMFTDGNIKDLNVAFLSPEDRQTFKANILYRKEKRNGFAETKSFVLSLAGTEYVNDPIETYDLSGFCTKREHAIKFGKFILSNRKLVDHTITFKTAPNYVNGLQPGNYIRVFSTTQHVQRFNNGAILDDGTVVSKDTISGVKSFYYWNPSEQVVRDNQINFSDSNAVKAFAGTLFTIIEEKSSNQCYKVESMTFGEDGLIEIAASYSPLTSDGKLAILQGWDDGSRFAPIET